MTKKYHYTARQIAGMRQLNRQHGESALAQIARYGFRSACNFAKVAAAVALAHLLIGWLGCGSLRGFFFFAVANCVLACRDSGVVVWTMNGFDCALGVLYAEGTMPYPQVEGDMPDVQVVPPGPDERRAREYDEAGGLGYAHWDAVRRGAGTAG